jgi:hypothetical protein
MRITIAVIGSFKQHNDVVQRACATFRSAGLEVTSPVGNEVVTPAIPFVRFTTDQESWSDAAVQSLALHRILRASITYVVAPDGYVGRTTCYEIGRLLQARRPLYFSDAPKDLPIFVAPQFVMPAEELAKHLITPGWQPSWLHVEGDSLCQQMERELTDGRYRED